MITKLTGDSNHWSLIFLNINGLNYKKAQGNRLDMKRGSILLLQTRNTPQRQTSSQSKGLGKNIPIK